MKQPSPSWLSLGFMQRVAEPVSDVETAEDTAPRVTVQSIVPRYLTVPQLLVLAAMAVGGLLRFVNLATVPPGLMQDEAVNGYDAYSLFLSGRDQHGHPFPFAGLESFGDWLSPLLTFLTAPVVGIFGLHVGNIRGVTAAIGVLAIPIVYLLGVQLLRRQSVAVLAAWYIALDPWAVHNSRVAITTAMVPTMVALTMLVLVWTVQHHSSRGVVALGIVAGLTIASFPTMKLYVPLLLLAALFVYGNTIIRLNREALFYAVVVFTVIAGPIYYLFLRDPGVAARWQQVSIFHAKWVTVTPLFLAKQYESYISPHDFVLNFQHPGWAPAPPGVGVELRVAAPFFLIGLLWLILAVRWPAQPTDRRSALLLLAALVFYPIPGSLTLPTPPQVSPNLLHAVALLPLVALLAGLGVMAAVDYVRHLLRNTRPDVRRAILALAIVGLGTVTSGELLVRYRYYFTEYPHQSSALAYFRYGLGAAVGYARFRQGAYDRIYFTDFDQPYIFVLFYDHWSPNDVHSHLEVRRNPPDLDWVVGIGKYRFVDPPGVKSSDLVRVYTVRDPVGRAVVEVLSGDTESQGRILWIRKP